ncbi:MAG: hypothetical protein COZ46_06280 [Verrucomicrobia bacterium CG_4_10_14_3_um_filter_43_23]|nr:MAG: hypothetical protein AUJ82_07995 [Verrucomicrobia bacterium CG1_02_43_26]PIX58002.1 MAG: hypothetical protein COZ46_06280 [Verrucomicrobia bacterium CG_4_10_14_3_um_filter_43_23]PJA43978.1 MAG: hypothetical protein CO175_05375 [Verrucomicrobia bacterium CG_4_9_14_3_um_filter_43_20]
MIVATITPDGFVQLPDEVLNALSLTRGQNGQKLTFDLDTQNNQVIVKSSREDSRRLLGKPQDAKKPGSRSPFAAGPRFRPRRRGVVSEGTRGIVRTTRPQSPTRGPSAPGTHPPAKRDSRTRFL